MNSNQSKYLASVSRELTLNWKEFSNALGGAVDSVKPLKHLIGEPHAEAKGSRLIAAGMAFIALPDPTVTDLIGVTLVAAGLMKNRMQQTTVADVYKEFQKATIKLENLKQEIRCFRF